MEYLTINNIQYARYEIVGSNLLYETLMPIENKKCLELRHTLIKLITLICPNENILTVTPFPPKGLFKIKLYE